MNKNWLNCGAFRSGIINYPWLAKAILFPLLLLASTADAASFVPGERFSSIGIDFGEEGGEESQSLSLDINDHTLFNESLAASSAFGAELITSQISSVSSQEIHYHDNLIYNRSSAYVYQAEAGSEFTFGFEITSPSLFELDWQTEADTVLHAITLSQSIAIHKDGIPLYLDTPFFLDVDIRGLGTWYFGPFGYLIGCPDYCNSFSPYSDSYSGLIEPGHYTLSIRNNITLWEYYGAGAASSIDFNFALIPIPLPASSWLMMLGLGSLFGFRRIHF